MATKQDGIIAYDKLTNKSKNYQEYGKLFYDLFFSPDASTSLIIDIRETENYMDIAKTLIDTGFFNVEQIGQYGQYFEFIPRKLEF